MERALEQVEQHCFPQLDAYSRCVERFSSNWEAACWPQRQKLSRCSGKYVSEVRIIKQACPAELDAHHACLERHREEPERCADEADRLYRCTDRAMSLPGDIDATIGGRYLYEAQPSPKPKPRPRPAGTARADGGQGGAT